MAIVIQGSQPRPRNNELEGFTCSTSRCGGVTEFNRKLYISEKGTNRNQSK
jgi:hypothetical protein